MSAGEGSGPSTGVTAISHEVKRSRPGSKRKFVSRREEIVDLAARLFAANGYNATGIREIGEASNLQRGALYYYIDSKESLLSEIHDRVLDPLLESTGAIAQRDLPAGERLCLVSEVLLRQIVDRHDHVWVFLHEYRSLTGERRETFRRKRAEFEQIVSGLLSAGVESGEFEFEDLRMTTLAFLGLHNSTYQWVHREAPLDAANLSRIYCRIFLTGIASSSKRASA